MNRRKRKNKFTLIELLIVIAILAILVSILLPALGKARDKAREMTCISNLKQIGTYTHLYLSDWNGYYPAADWTIRVQSYMKNAAGSSFRIFRCPGAPPTVRTGSHAGKPLVQAYSVSGEYYTSSLGDMLRFSFYLIPEFRAKDSQISIPTQKIYLTDHGEYAYADNTGQNDRKISNRHSGKGSILLADGHVRTQSLPATVGQYDAAQCKPSEEAYIVNSKKGVTFY